MLDGWYCAEEESIILEERKNIMVSVIGIKRIIGKFRRNIISYQKISWKSQNKKEEPAKCFYS